MHSSMPPSAMPQPPEEPEYPPNSTHQELHRAVYDALFALPNFFRSELNIAKVSATDLFTFNTSLGATIETQVVEALNQLRNLWDPKQEYSRYRFIRQSQRFPDVILRTIGNEDPPILMGIELKGWYALAKEKEPSFRYRVTPAVCAPADLLAVFPWTLDSVISGSPSVLQPYVVNARWAASYRNWHWEYQRETSGRLGIMLSTATQYYPSKNDPIADMPAYDEGGNFGRFARTKLMDAYRERIFAEELAGIPIRAWVEFLKIFSQDQPEEIIIRKLQRMAADVDKKRPLLSNDAVHELLHHLSAIVDILQPLDLPSDRRRPDRGSM